jgi:hypothetical protein
MVAICVDQSEGGREVGGGHDVSIANLIIGQSSVCSSEGIGWVEGGNSSFDVDWLLEPVELVVGDCLCLIQ